MARTFKAELVGCFGPPVAEKPTGVMREAAVAGARAMGFRGFNLTAPRKVAVIPLLDGLSREAAVIGAVNTVRWEGDRLIGENTDGKGFLRGVREDARVDVTGNRVVLLLAGGAARAIATELLGAGGAGMVADLAAKTGGGAGFWPGRTCSSTQLPLDCTRMWPICRLWH